MKLKIMAIFCVLCIICCMPASILAEDFTVDIKIANMSEDIINISSTAPMDSAVSIMILNPGVETDALNFSTEASNAGDIQYFGYLLSDNGAFSQDIKIRTLEGGIFKIIVNVGAKRFETGYPFYPYGKKLSLVDVVKNATDPVELERKIPEILEVFGLSTHVLYTTSTPKDVADIICDQNDNYKLNTPDDVLDFLNEMLVYNAFINKNENLVVDKNLAFSDIWTNSDEAYYEDYKNNISEEGKAKINNAIFAGNYDKLSDVYIAFTNEVAFHAIMNNALSGSGHIEGLLNKYNDKYAEKGFDLSLLDTAKNKKEKFTTLLGSGVTSLTDLASQFNKIFGDTEEDDEGSKPSGPVSEGRVPSGGGGGGGASAPNPTQTPTTTPTPSNTPEPTAPISACPFSDMTGADWAEDAVEYLYKEGIINGRSENTFAPNETVTRAELVKMIVEAFEVTAGNESAAFGDVTEGDWYASYIKKAASAGIVNGADGAFRPNDGITREDAALIIFRALGLENSGEITFSDAADISDYAKDAISAMVENGYINGMGDGSFKPKATLTRAQAAQLIYNAITKGGNAQ